MNWKSKANFIEKSTFPELLGENDTIIPPETKSAEIIESQLKEIPKEFIGRGEVRGFIFKQLIKNNCCYIYQVMQSCGLIHFEVFVRVRNPRFICISYPGSKSFGVSAWCCRTVEDALKKFNK